MKANVGGENYRSTKALIWIMLSKGILSYLVCMSPPRQALAQIDRHIADLERRIAEQREHRGADSFAAGEILYLLERTLMAMKTRKARLSRPDAFEVGAGEQT